MNEDDIKWRYSVVPAEEETVRSIEQSLGRGLPLDVRSFLKRFHGGYPEDMCICFEHAGRRNCFFVGQFVSLLPGGEAYLLDDLAIYRGRIPSELIPFAEEAGGSLFCLDFRQDPPQISFWDHELEGLPESITPVARSFTLFLEATEIFDEARVRAWTSGN